MASATEEQGYILGLDIGTHSVGWAAIETDDGEPCGILRAGVRVFQAGVDETQYEQGKADPPGAKRRQMRAQRRLTARRVRRKRKLLHILQRAGLLPDGEPGDIFPELDKRLLEKFAGVGDSEGESGPLPHVLHYWLRARALDHPLEPHEFGRAVYHLGQRRGFQSNRRTPQKEGEDRGQLMTAISELRDKMEKAGARTLGEFFAQLDPREKRIRDRYTEREMFKEEFNAIWEAQALHHPGILTQELREAVHDAIFYQRPLKNQSYLIGGCTLEENRRRAPWALLDAQGFRILQKVNDTRVLPETGPERDLTEKERNALAGALDRKHHLTFLQAKKAMGLSRDCVLNWESGGEKRLPGNRTNAKFEDIFGDRWWGLTREQRDQVVEDVLSYEKRDALARRGRRHWGLDKEAAQELAHLELEGGYCRLSRKALGKLLPHMERGLRYQEAARKCYPERWDAGEALEELPALRETDLDCTNPVVRRSLTEMRKVVNAVVRHYGKPQKVRIEMARDLRKSAAQRAEATQRARRNQQRREAAAQKIVQEAGIQNPSRQDIEKVLLAEECKWTCPYTGRGISMDALLGANPQFDVEHIVPFSRSLDNSYLNKTLCYAPENRHKRNHTPWEAYGGNEERWNKIIARVQDFKGDAAQIKLRRFKQREPDSLDQVAQRQLNDTRYASKAAGQYVALLFGGTSDEAGSRRVEAARGGVTAYIRDMYALNSILGDGPGKERSDHRHHAVDAMAIALTSPSSMQQISQRSSDLRNGGRMDFRDVVLPWDTFLDDLRAAIEPIAVSHRPRRGVNGPLHDETLYGPVPQEHGDGRHEERARVRKRVDALSSGDVDKIVDRPCREAVRRKLAELGGTPRQPFKDPANHPHLVGGDGRRIPIHSVTIETSASTVPIGHDENRRYVLTNDNHHMAIVEHTDGRGRPRWKGVLVSRLQAGRRLREGEPVVQRPEGFQFSLASGDMIELDREDGDGRRLCVVRSISGGKVEFVPINDARIKKDIKDAGMWITRSPNRLRQLHCQKVNVNPFGQVRRAND